MFDWAEYLRLARTLGTQTYDEAALRSAISRAYYAAFGTAAQDLRSRGTKLTTRGGVHKQVIDLFKSDSDPRLVQVGVELDRLRRDRNRADYRPVVNDLGVLVPDALARASGVVQQLGVT